MYVSPAEAIAAPPEEFLYVACLRCASLNLSSLSRDRGVPLLGLDAPEQQRPFDDLLHALAPGAEKLVDGEHPHLA